jgi:hypothetical protein
MVVSPSAIDERAHQKEHGGVRSIPCSPKDYVGDGIEAEIKSAGGKVVKQIVRPNVLAYMPW